MKQQQAVLITIFFLLFITGAYCESVNITNHLGEDVVIICQSADDVVYNDRLHSEEHFGWSFGIGGTIGRKTLFYCDATWGYKTRHFDAYDQEWMEHPIDADPDSVAWEIYQDGFTKMLDFFPPERTVMWSDPGKVSPIYKQCGRFKNTCNYMELQGSVLGAACANGKGESVISNLDLNAHIGVLHGHLVPNGAGFTSSCSDLHLFAGEQQQLLYATCNSGWQGVTFGSQLYLENFVNNNNGNLEWCA